MKTPLAQLIEIMKQETIDTYPNEPIITALAWAINESEKLLPKERETIIDFHMSVMEKGLENEASKYKRSEWDKIVREVSEKHFNENFEQ